MIKVIKPGLHSTIQDEGRLGYYEIGMPPSGALDNYSYVIANLLVGNEKGTACLEMTYTGPELEFQKDAQIAITGGKIPPKINGKDISMWKTIFVKSGDILKFDYLRAGARTYLAIAGGIEVPEVLGSSSTYVLSGIGGLQGRSLQKGDELSIGNHQKRQIIKEMEIPEKYWPKLSDSYEIRIMDGMFSYRITDESKKILVETEWIVTPDSNRVGYRIQGGTLDFVDRIQPFGAGSSLSNVVEAGYPIGCIQVPDGSEPIILLKDAVTCGGYPTIATVISSDLNILGQVKINDKIRFKYVTIEEALEERRNIFETLEQVEKFIYKNNTLKAGEFK